MYVEQRKSGRWTGRYRDHNGKLRSAGTFDTREEAGAAALASEQGMDRGEERQSTISMGAYFEKWMGAHNVNPRTKLGYQSVYRNHLDKHLGHMPVDDITSKDIRRALTPLIEAEKLHLAHKCKAALGSVFRSLVDEGVIESSPMAGVRVPPAAREPFTPLDPEDFKAIVAELPSEETRLFAEFLVGSGLRYGEAVALRVSDIDLRTSELHVRRRLVTINMELSKDGSRYVEQEATKSGHKRVVPLSAALVEKVLAHVEKHGLEGGDLIFGRAQMTGKEPNTNPGEQYLRWEWWSDVWKAAVQEVGLPWTPRTHDLRHAHATILVVSGVDMFEVQQRLGHRSMNTTQIYLHRVAAMKSKAAAASDVFL